jgi:hypothetical protein
MKLALAKKQTEQQIQTFTIQNCNTDMPKALEHVASPCSYVEHNQENTVKLRMFA